MIRAAVMLEGDIVFNRSLQRLGNRHREMMSVVCLHRKGFERTFAQLPVVQARGLISRSLARNSQFEPVGFVCLEKFAMIQHDQLRREPIVHGKVALGGKRLLGKANDFGVVFREEPISLARLRLQVD